MATKYRAITMVGPHDYIDPNTGVARPKIQLSTALCVDMASPPLWFLHVGFRPGPPGDNEPFAVENWKPWMWDLTDQMLYLLIPDYEKREPKFRDINKFGIDYRFPLSDSELVWLKKPVVLAS